LGGVEKSAPTPLLKKAPNMAPQEVEARALPHRAFEEYIDYF